MNNIDLIIPLGTSILIGGLIGLEREKTKQESEGLSAVGIRTDILISLFGAISAFFGLNTNPLIFYMCLGALLIFTISSYLYLSIVHQKTGVTTEISTILVFLYGAMTIYGYSQIAIGLAIITTLVLSVRTYIHKAIYNLNQREIFDTIKFAIIAFIILPFLPNQNFDTQILQFFFPNHIPPASFNLINVINPYNIWFLVVLVSGISFLGYIMVKIIGKQRGIAFSGLIGGLYSSTATSLTLATKSKELPRTTKPFIAGIVLACAISFIRSFIEIRAVNAELFGKILIPVFLMFIYLLIAGIFLAKSSKNEIVDESEKKFETPFTLIQAIKLGGFIILALVASKLLLTYTDVKFYYAAASIMSFIAIDDPITISTATAAGSILSLTDAKNILLISIFLNMIQKAVAVYFFGNKKLFKPLLTVFGGLFLVTLAGIIYF